MRRWPRIAALTFRGADTAITVPERGGPCYPPAAKRTRRRTRSAPPPAGSGFARLANNLPLRARGDDSPAGRHIGNGPFQSGRVALSRPVCGSPAPHRPPGTPFAFAEVRGGSTRPGLARVARRSQLEAGHAGAGHSRRSSVVGHGGAGRRSRGGLRRPGRRRPPGVYGRWDRAPAFAVVCVVVGALFGLFGGARGALFREPAPGSSQWPSARGSFPAPLAVPSGPSGRHPRQPGLRPVGGQPGRRPISPRRRAIGRLVPGWDCPPLCR